MASRVTPLVLWWVALSVAGAETARAAPHGLDPISRSARAPPRASLARRSTPVGVDAFGSMPQDAGPPGPDGPDGGAGQGVKFEVLRKQLGIFSTMAAPYFRESPQAKRQLGAVLALTLLNSGISVLFSYVGRDFWTALSAKDSAHFYELMLKFAGALVVGTPISVQYKFQRAQLALAWRAWMTEKLTEAYLKDRSYYEIDLAGTVDNPDQRLTDDVKFFTRVSLDFSITVLTSVIDLVNFSLILYNIYPPLFAAIFAYAAFGTGVTLVLGKSLVGLNFAQLRKEADLRYLLVRLRENAEAIAFYRGEGQEALGTGARLAAAVGNARELLGVQRRLEFFTIGYRYLIQILPILVVAPLYFQGSVELGVISQSVGAFNHVLSDLSIIVNEIESLSAFSAGVDRLGQLVEQLGWVEARTWADGNGTAAVPLSPGAGGGDEAAPQAAQGAADHGAGGANPDAATAARGAAGGHHDAGTTAAGVMAAQLAADELLRLTNVAVATPGAERVLSSGLSLSVKRGAHVLVTGASGCGKSSLLRVLAGLWQPHAGHIAWGGGMVSHTDTGGGGGDTAAGGVNLAREADMGQATTTSTPACGPDGLMFLPQKPYCPIGSLRDQLLYPRRAVEAPEWTGERLQAVLREVQLAALLERAESAVGSSRPLVDPDLPLSPEEAAVWRPVHAGEAKDAHGEAVVPHAQPSNDPLDLVCDWSDVLSLGEQQRLGFARVLTNAPAVLLLDESTSALDLDTEAAMYKLLSHSLPNLTFISVGHRPSLRRFHHVALKMGGQTPVLEPIEEGAASVGPGVGAGTTPGTVALQNQKP